MSWISSSHSPSLFLVHSACNRCSGRFVHVALHRCVVQTIKGRATALLRHHVKNPTITTPATFRCVTTAHFSQHDLSERKCVGMSVVQKVLTTTEKKRHWIKVHAGGVRVWRIVSHRQEEEKRTTKEGEWKKKQKTHKKNVIKRRTEEKKKKEAGQKKNTEWWSEKRFRSGGGRGGRGEGGGEVYKNVTLHSFEGRRGGGGEGGQSFTPLPKPICLDPLLSSPSPLPSTLFPNRAT